jgi:DNA-binding response OmpR family regulator
MQTAGTRIIFLVEDDPLISKAWILGLSQGGYQVVHAPLLKSAIGLLNEKRFDAAIIDINLPDGSGIEILRCIRQSHLKLKTLIVTAKQDEESAVVALDLGATEFIRKPVGPRELQTRLDRLFQYGDEPAIQVIQHHDFLVTETIREINFKGLSLKLSSSEYKILSLLIRQFGHSISREQILDVFENKSDISDRSIDSHISRIRKKMKDSGADNYSIESVWGTGYVLNTLVKK